MSDLQTVPPAGDLQALTKRPRLPHRRDRAPDHQRQNRLVMGLGEADDAAEKPKNIFAVLHRIGSHCGGISVVSASKCLNNR